MPQKKWVHKSLTLTTLPNGTFLETETGYYYVLGLEKRLRFTTDRVLKSWSPQRIVKASETDPAVQKLKITGKMPFRAGSLLYCQANGTMYLVSDEKLRPLNNPSILGELGIRRQDAVWVSTEELSLHTLGENIG